MELLLLLMEMWWLLMVVVVLMGIMNGPPGPCCPVHAILYMHTFHGS